MGVTWYEAEAYCRWLSAQEHYGENIGDTPTHTLFVELKEPAPELRVTITLSGCWCGVVRCPGVSRYSSTRTRAFSKSTR